MVLYHNKTINKQILKINSCKIYTKKSILIFNDINTYIRYFIRRGSL